MEMLLNVIVGLMISCTSAVYVRRLEGSVYLSRDNCESSSCPKPLRGGTSVNLVREKLAMKCSWKENMPYSFYYEEPVVDRRNRQFEGSQTSCNRFTNGTYNCTPQPGYYCYAYVNLGFRARSCSRVSIQTPARYMQKEISGAEVLQIYSLANVVPSEVRFELECNDGSPCLEDNLTVMSLLYRCHNN